MIKQHTKEWLEAKKTKIGGSEIFTLAHYYCKKELEQIGINLKELPFKTALELYLEKKFGIQSEPIDPICAEFGLGMEKYIIHRLNKENRSINVTSSSNFEINDELNLACCSPDGFVEVSDEIQDYDKRTLINKESGSGMLEVKTTQFTFNYEAAAGPKWQYIFQLNYNMLVCKNSWGLLACLTPKEKEFDTDFFKGKVLGLLEGAKNQLSSAELAYNEHLEYLDNMQFYNLYTYFYTGNKTIQNICKLALERFQNAMDNDLMPLASVDNLEKLMREKKMLSKMFPEKFGKLQANQSLNELLNERGIVNNQLKIDETAKEEINCKLIQAMGHHIELEGFNYIAKFDKKGSLRVSQNKDSFVTQGMINKLLEDVEIPNYMGA